LLPPLTSNATRIRTSKGAIGARGTIAGSFFEQSD
jgi:hypothetical protein